MEKLYWRGKRGVIHFQVRIEGLFIGECTRKLVFCHYVEKIQPYL